MPSVRKIVAEAAKQQQLQQQQQSQQQAATAAAAAPSSAPAAAPHAPVTAAAAAAAAAATTTSKNATTPAEAAAAAASSKAHSSSAAAAAAQTSSSTSFSPPARAQASTKPPRKSEGSIEVVARHAIQGTEVTVTLPKRAKFKHLKKAVAGRLGSDEILSRGQIMRKENGVYTSFKDEKKIGDVRTVLVVCADFSTIAKEEAPVCSIDEEDVSSDEELQATLAVGSSKASSSTAPFGRHPEEPLTLDSAIELQRELLEGFSKAAFKEELSKLTAQKSELKPAAFAQKRQELFLTVQKTVLPSYGFEGSRSGVYKMFAAMGPFVKEPEFVKLGNEINAILGIESRPETWDDLSSSCRKLEASQGALALTDRDRSRPEDPNHDDTDDSGDSDDDGQSSSSEDNNNNNNKNKKSKKLSDSAAKARAKAASRARFGLGIGTSVMSAAFPSQSRSMVLGLDQVAEENHQHDMPSSQAARQNSKEEQATDSQADFECWPAERSPPFALTIMGSWTAGRPSPMSWDPENGVFVSIMQVGASGRESFQLLINGDDEKTIYPHFKDAGPFEVHDILGPDAKSRGRAWTMGMHKEEEVAPGRAFAVLAALDVRGKVRQVDWRLLDAA